MRRRQLLTATAIGIAGIAGCSSSDGETGTETGAGNATDTSMSTPTETASMDDGGAGDLASPEATVQTFYDTLYGNDDIEAANELYHPDSEAPPLAPENFEDFGGVSAIGAELQSTEVVSEAEATTEIHATVDYSTPAGSATQVDWFTLAQQGDQWLVMVFYPESARNQASTTPTASN